LSRVDVARGRPWRRRSGNTELGKDTSSGVFVFGDFDYAHASRALRTHADVDGEHSPEEAGPRMSRRFGRWSEISLFIRFEEWQLDIFLDWLLENDLGAHFGIRGEDTVISVHVKSRRRDESRETCDEIQGLEQDDFCAVFPGLLEPVAQTAVAVLFESIERERWASDISANSLESLSIATIDGEAGVDIHALELGI
jgi:hypothetical protein